MLTDTRHNLINLPQEMGYIINFQVLQLYAKNEVTLGHEGTAKPEHYVCNEQSIADCGTGHVKVESCNTNKQVDTVKLQGMQLSLQGNVDYKISCEKCKPWQNCFAS